jgi:hypothetical protein
MKTTFILCRKCLRRTGCRGTLSLTKTMGQSMACRWRTVGIMNNLAILPKIMAVVAVGA